MIGWIRRRPRERELARWAAGQSAAGLRRIGPGYTDDDPFTGGLKMTRTRGGVSVNSEAERQRELLRNNGREHELEWEI